MSDLAKVLDETQYTRRSILRYEWMYGEGGLSNGGPAITAEIAKLVKFLPTDDVLDIGCGIGGPAFHIAETYGCSVHGVDFSHNMMEIARERLEEKQSLKDKVTLQECDFLKAGLKLLSYDVIHCRDTMVHVKEKLVWLLMFKTLLKPGGNLVITDYCRGKETNSEDYKEYINQRGYAVVTTSEYCDLIGKAGFVEIHCESRAKQYGQILEEEINKLQERREEFIQKFSPEEYEQMLNSWKAKLGRKDAGDHIWAVITAKKP